MRFDVTGRRRIARAWGLGLVVTIDRIKHAGESKRRCPGEARSDLFFCDCRLEFG